MTTFLNNNITDNDAMIAAKNAEMEAFRLELEKLKEEKSKMVRIKKEDEAKKYELPFYDVTVQKYKVEPDNLYEYRRDEDFGDEWDLYVIYHDGSKRKASLKK